MKIGPYEVLGELGRGGMGLVYRVRAPDGREVALKLLLQTNQAAFARFDRERRLLMSLGEQDGFVGLLDAGVAPEGAWLLMPFMPGGTLRQKLANGPLGIDETSTLGVELARALGAAHARGIVHRDVKPENVLFAASGRALLADLGIAKHFDRGAAGASQSVSLTQDGVAKGTAGYMAPEQLRDAASVGPAADVFALGATLYECLAGRPAFEGESVIETITKLESGVVAPIDRPGVPASLEKVVRRALARDPRERFPDGASLARAIAPDKKTEGNTRRLVPLVLGAALGGALVIGALVVVFGRAGAEPPRALPPPAPRPAAADSMAEALALVKRGNEKLGAGDAKGALADGEQAVKLAPRLARAWALRGVARVASHNSKGAIADLTRAIELDPKLAIAYVNRGNALWGENDLEGALRDATSAIDLDPGIPQAWTNRSSAKLDMNELDGAIEDASKAVALDPRQATAWSNRANARLDKHDPRGAVDDASKAIALSPDLVVAWATRGAARSELGNQDDAIKDLDRAIELVPGSAMFWRDRGQAKLRKRDFKGAQDDLERCLSLAPENMDTAFVRDLLEEAKRGAR